METSRTPLGRTIRPYGYPESPTLSLGYTPDLERGDDITPLESPSIHSSSALEAGSISQSSLRNLHPSIHETPRVFVELLTERLRALEKSQLTNAIPDAQLRSSRNRNAHFDNPSNARNRTAAHQDHDIMAGLPVQNWTRKSVFVSQVPPTDFEDPTSTKPKTKWDEDLPMPLGSEFLPAHAREILRLARRGITTRQPWTKVEKEPEEVPDKEDGEDNDKTATENGFIVQKWVPVPRYDERPFPKFVAERRKGLMPLYGPTAGQHFQAPQEVVPLPTKEVKVKKVDPATGSTTIYKMLIAEGQAVDGEIVEDEPATEESAAAPVAIEAPAAGTVVEGLGVANSQGVIVAPAVQVAEPVKKRPMPPRRKAKTPKGRRKKVMIAPGQGLDAAVVHTEGGAPADGSNGAPTGVDGAPDLQDGGEEDENTDEEGSDEDGSVSEDEAKSPHDAPMHSTTDLATEPEIPPPADDEPMDLEPAEPPTIAEAPAELEVVVESSNIPPDVPVPIDAIAQAESIAEATAILTPPPETPVIEEPASTSAPITIDAIIETVPVREPPLTTEADKAPMQNEPALVEVKPEEGEMDLFGSLEAELNEPKKEVIDEQKV